MSDEYSSCHLCPRDCGIDRNKARGACGVGSTLQVSRASLHYWEEPCISGTRGSGTVFFSGCSLRCVFCQNYEISRARTGRQITLERLVEIFFELKEQGANNINLVTADHFLPTIAGAIEAAKLQGIGLPFLLNTSSYVKTDTLKRMEGLIDIYLPDLKYIRDKDAGRYSRAFDYPGTAKAAISEMVRQQPECIFTEERQGKGKEPVQILEKGVVVRHLLLPGQLIQAKLIVNWLYKTFGDSIYISLLSQYIPEYEALTEDYSEIGRRVTQYEYRSLIRYASGIGVIKGFIQDGEAADEGFIPEFDLRGV